MADRSIDIIIQAQNNAKKDIEAVQKQVQELTKETNKASKSLNDFANKNQDNFKKMAGVGTVAFGAISLGIKKVTDKASDLEETTQKFGVVYRDLADEANKTAKELADGYGLSQKASKQFLADLGDVTSGFGLSQEASLDYATQVTKLGVDLASFANIAGGSEEAIDRLNKGFLGEHENLKALGIIINDTMLKKQLLADGTSELTGLELEQAKIQARMTIAMSQSKNAIGDFERSKASLANQTRILQANMEDVTTELGNAFLPVITEITKALIPVIQSFAKWAGENPELVKILGITTIAIAGVITVLGVLGLAIPGIIAGVTALGTALMFLAANPIGLVITAIGALVAAGIWLISNWEDVKLNLGGALYFMLQDVKEKLGAIKDFFLQMGNDIYNGFIGWIDSLKNGLTEKMDAAFNYVKNKVAAAKAMLSSIGSKISDSVSSAVSSVSQTISGARATGGPVTGGQSYLVGEKGPELFTPPTSGRIIPNNKMGGSANININMGGVVVNNGQDEQQFFEKVKKTMIEVQRNAQFGY